MLNTNMDQTAMDFPMSTAKPGQYSVKELPKIASDLTKPSGSHIQKSQSKLEKIYQIITSLPVTTALLTAITSQGVPVGGSLWYLNYSAILVILLTAVAVAVSRLSVTASHSYCETVFLTIYTPISQLFNVSVDIRDMHQDEPSANERPAKYTPAWFKQLLFMSIVLAATEGLNFTSVIYIMCMTIVYSCISSQIKSRFESSKTQKLVQSVSMQNHFYTTALLAAVAVDILANQAFGAMNLLYFTLTDGTTVKSIKQTVENRNIEIMEGLEQYYAEGLIQLAEISLTLVALVAQPYVCLWYIPVLYFCIYKPVTEFRTNVKRINSESLCLSNFQKATVDDISSYDDVCAVCLCAMNYARITPCGHIFHGKCLKDCLQKKAQCPMCNTQIL